MIVVVEPNMDEQSMIVRTLESRGLKSFRMARDAKLAIDMLLEAEDARLPRLVLMDLDLPMVRGLEFVRLLRNDERSRRVPIVCLIDSMDPGCVINAYDAGASAVLVKPVDYEAYGRMIQATCEFWIDLTEPAYPPSRHTNSLDIEGSSDSMREF